MRKRLILCYLAILMGAMSSVFSQTFRHPGLLHSEEDFENIKARIAAGDEQTLVALEALKTAPPVLGDHGHNWGVNEVIIRGIDGENHMNAYRNAARAYQMALIWKITGDEAAGNWAIDILNAYRIWNKSLHGNTNISLIPGFIGYQLINAAEIMRDYRNWPEEDFRQFKQYMIDVWFTVAQDFLERRHDTVVRENSWIHYYSNWGLGNALFCISLGVLCDSPDIYNYGMYWLKEGPANESLCITAEHPDERSVEVSGYGWGLIPWFHEDERGPLGYFCQMQENGRDQGHSLAALGLLSYALQSAYNQGDNAFCNLYNPLVEGKAGTAMVAGAAEYVAAYNVGVDDLPFTTNWWMTGFNANSRGQWRPIWQLLINHYKNRMGIDMPYCQQMKDIIGMELGGGSYAISGSGGYDFTGFGDLMHYDQQVHADSVPTILQPVIMSENSTRYYAEISNVEPGTVLTLSVSLPNDEENTGNWHWEDGAIGQQRQINVDKSGVYRVTYTNEAGVESTQMFSVAVAGEGIEGTLNTYVTYDGHNIEGYDVRMGIGKKVTISTTYSTWNYIQSEIWTDEKGNQIATGGTITYTLKDEADHILTFTLTNQSGVKSVRTFNIIYDENDFSYRLSDAECEDVSAWTTDVDGFQIMTSNVPGLSQPFIERWRIATQDGADCWGMDTFDIGQQLTGLPAGKYTLSASVVATQQTFAEGDDKAKGYVQHVYLYANGVNEAVSSPNNEGQIFSVDFYVGNDGKANIGLRNIANQNKPYSEAGLNWVAMDCFALIYNGTDFLVSDLDSMRAEAAAFTEDMVPSSVCEKLRTLSEETDMTVSALVELQSVLSEAQVIQKHYAFYKSCHDRYKAYMETYPNGSDALVAAITTFENATTAKELIAAWQAMQAAWFVLIENSPVALDITADFQDATIDKSSNGSWMDIETRWRTDVNGGNMRIFEIDGSGVQRGTAEGQYMIERYHNNNFQSGERLFYMIKNGMPLGNYSLSGAAQKGAGTGVINLFVNDSLAAVNVVKNLRNCSVSAEVTDGILSFGMRADDGNACNWASFADAKLVYKSAYVLIDETIEKAEELLMQGEDTDGKLAETMTAAKTIRSEGTNEDRLEQVYKLRAAIAVFETDNFSIPDAPATDNTDVTSWIVNPNFDNFDLEGWSGWGDTGNVSKGYFELVSNTWYAPTFNLYQDIILPNGVYQLSVQQHSNIGDRVNLYLESSYQTQWVNMNWNDASLTWANNPEAGSRIYTGEVLVVDNKIRVGVNAHTANNSQSLYFDSFKLTYVNDGRYSVKAQYEAKVEEIQSAIANLDYLPQAFIDRAEIRVNAVVEPVTIDAYNVALSEATDMYDMLNSPIVPEILKELSNAEVVIGAMSDGDAKDALHSVYNRTQEQFATVNNAGLVTLRDELRVALVAAMKSGTVDLSKVTGVEILMDSYDFEGSFDGWNFNGARMGLGDGVAEFWNTNFDTWRSLTSLPAGWYQVEVNALYVLSVSTYASWQEKLDKNTAVIFADNNGPGARYSVPAKWRYEEDCSDLGEMGDEGMFPVNRYQANLAFNANRYKTIVHVYVDENGNLNYGIAGTNQAADWICFDKFKVYYKGSDLSAMWDSMKENAEDLALKVSDDYKTAIESIEKPATVDADAIWSLNETMKNTVNVANKVAEVGVTINGMSWWQEYLDNSEASVEDKERFINARVSIQETRKNDIKSVEEAEALLMRCEEARFNYIDVATPNADYRFDMRFLLTNPSTFAWKAGSAPTGWYTDVDGHVFQVQQNANQAGTEVTPTVWEFVERWAPFVLKPTNGSGWLLYQQTALPRGTYHLKAATFSADPGNGDAAITHIPSATLAAGVGNDAIVKGSSVNSNVLSWDNAIFTLDEATTDENPSKLGIFIDENNENNWFGIQYMELYKIAAQELTLNETDAIYAITEDIYANVTLNRSLKAGKWNTFCVPFDMPVDAFASVKQLTGYEERSDLLILTFTDAETIKAGVPYIVKINGEENRTQMKVNSVVVKSDSPQTLLVNDSVSMTGNYNSQKVPQGAYFISDNMFYYADQADAVNLKGFRAYINYNSPVNQVNRMLINIDGEITGVDEIEGLSVTFGSVDVYTLSGVKVRAGVGMDKALEGLKNGVYIVNGKKVVKH